MANMTDFLKNKMLDENLVDVFVGLYTGGEELGAASYKRMPISFASAVEGQTLNTEDVFFPIAEEYWGRISEVAIYDSEAGGNMLFKARADYIKDINVSSQYKIPENYLIIRLK